MGTDSGGVSRRRVLQGAAWTAPVILVATSAPARAASPPLAGLIAFGGVSANLTDTTLTVNVKVSYVGDGAPSPDLPVSNLVVSVVVPSTSVTGATPDASSPWTYLSSSVQGTDTVFQFIWQGSDLSASLPVTTNLAAQFARTDNDHGPLSITVLADGESNSQPVPQISYTVSTIWGAAIVFNVYNPIQGQSNYQGEGAAYVFYGQVRWNGPWYPEGQPVGQLRVTATVPEAAGTGTLILGNIGAGWTKESGPELVSGVWTVVYTYSGTLGVSPLPGQTDDLQFALGAIDTPPPLNVANLTAEGATTADATPVAVSHTGPAVSGFHEPITTPYPPDYPG